MLNAKQIEHTKANPEKRVEIPVGLPSGLYIVVHPSGRKSWAFRYRWHGKPTKLTLGAYPGVSLAAARASANAAIAELRAGRDPVAVKAGETSEPTSVEAVAREWLERDVRPRTRTAREVGRIVNKEIVPPWRGKLIVDIARPDILRLLDKIADRGALSMANHVLATVKRMLNWAVQRGYVQASVAATVRPLAGEKSRDRVLTEDELRDAWNAAPSLGYPFGPFVRLLILTAQRRGELAGMRSENVDLKSCLWTLPKEQTKSGRVHDVPLSRQTVEILRELPRFERGSYVFTTTSGEKPVVGFSKAKRILDREILKRAGQKGRRLEYTMHDFRRTAATWLAQHGTPPHVLSAVLNHSPGAQQGVTAIYNRYRYSEERREALERWAEYVASLGKAKAQRRAS